MRCVFSETLNGRTLDAVAGTPPGSTAVRLLKEPPGEIASRIPSRILRWTTATAHAVLDDLVTTLFPAECRSCDGPLPAAGLTPVCGACLAKVGEQTSALCRCCSEALDVDLESDRFYNTSRPESPAEGLLCTLCRLAPPPFERAVAFGTYQAELREMIHLLKYERLRTTAKPLGAMLAKAIQTLDLSGEISVVAVPLFPAKERQRGYNQAVLLADAAASLLQRSTGLKLRAEHGLLRRVKNTESQYSLTAKGRRTNLRGAFAVDPGHALAGRTVLLVDDIYTTGSTARECARVLRRAGAAAVFVATLARAQTERVALWTLDGNGRSSN